MTDQLTLITDTHSSWRLDRSTREAGVRGVARARQALADARTRRPHDAPAPGPESDPALGPETDPSLAPAA